MRVLHGYTIGCLKIQFGKFSERQCAVHAGPGVGRARVTESGIICILSGGQ